MAVAAKVRTGMAKGLNRSADIKTAVAAVQHVPPHIRPAVRRHIIRKAKGIKGASRHIPPHWHPSGAIRHVRPAQALKLAEAAGVTLDLANDLNLAGKWKHGWIPLDAVATAVKAKRYHGGATHEVSSHSGPIHVRDVRDDANNKNMAIATVVRDHRKGTVRSHAPGENVWVAKAQVRPLGPSSKGRAGSAVEARREQSRGRVKAAIPAGRRQADSSGHLVVTAQSRRARQQLARLLGTERLTGHVNSDNVLGDKNDYYKIPLQHAAGAALIPGVSIRKNPPARLSLRDNAVHPARAASLDGRSAASMSPEERARAAEVMHGTGSKQHRKAVATAQAQQVAQDRHRSLEAARVGQDEAKVREPAKAAAGGKEGGKPRKGDLALISTTSSSYSTSHGRSEYQTHRLVRIAGTTREGGVSHYVPLGDNSPGRIKVEHGAKVLTIPRGQLDEAAIEREHSGFYHDQFPSVDDARAALLRHHLTNPREPEPGKGLTMQQQRVRGMSDTALQNEAKYHPDDHAIRAEMERRAAKDAGSGASAASGKPVRGKVKRYKLERTLPDGSVKQSEPVTLAEAERAMMGVLHYNQGVSKGEAGRLAPQLRHASVGQHVEAHGYKFRLVEAN